MAHTYSSRQDKLFSEPGEQHLTVTDQDEWLPCASLSQWNTATRCPGLVILQLRAHQENSPIDKAPAKASAHRRIIARVETTNVSLPWLFDVKSCGTPCLERSPVGPCESDPPRAMLAQRQGLKPNLHLCFVPATCQPLFLFAGTFSKC